MRAVHIEHGLHPDAHAWAQHCQAMSAALSVELVVEHVQVADLDQRGVEEAARRARYQALDRHIGSRDVLLTAHQQDDQAETVLLQLLRGAGVQGLAAMPAITAFGAGRHARPLLSFSRASIVNYARENDLRWIEDPSNAHVGLTRNRLRREIIPRLLPHWPALHSSLARAARHQAEAMMVLNEVALADLGSCRRGENSLHIPNVRRLSMGRQRNLLRFWIRCAELRAPSTAVLDRVLSLVRENPKTRRGIVAWSEGEVRRYRDSLIIGKHVSAAAAFSLTWRPPAPLVLPGQARRLTAVAATGEGLSRSRTAGTHITVRSRRGGEVCQLAGRAHHTQLKKLLQASGIPPWERGRIPLVYVDDEIAAIGDRWICEPFRAQAGEPAWRIRLEAC